MTRQSGAIAQLGERLNGIQEVSGSIPLGSTILKPLEFLAVKQRLFTYAVRQVGKKMLFLPRAAYCGGRACFYDSRFRNKAKSI
jgi:hypothetical protein